MSKPYCEHGYLLRRRCPHCDAGAEVTTPPAPARGDLVVVGGDDDGEAWTPLGELDPVTGRAASTTRARLAGGPRG